MMYPMRTCGGTPPSTWEAELPASDPRDAAEGRTRIVRIEQDAVAGCGHQVTPKFHSRDGAEPEFGRRLFEKAATTYLCSNCDAPPPTPPTPEGA